MALVELRGVAKAYGRHQVLQGADLMMVDPEILGLIGPNGAGKTTLLRAMLGLIRPQSGTVWLDGLEPLTGAHRLGVAYFGGETTLPPMVSERRWRRLMALPPSNHTDGRRFRVLSRGSRQMAGLRAVLDRDGVRLIVLDEPYEGLDPDGSRWLSRALRAKRNLAAGCVLSSHRLSDLAGVCDRYAFLLNGRLLVRTADELGGGTVVTGETLVKAFDTLKGYRS